MNQVPMQELNQNECSAALSGYGYNAQTSTCCRSKGADACLADVGSALACRMPTGNYVLRGVYSTETECNNSPNQLVTFAKMDTAWVRQSLNKAGGRVQGFNPQFAGQASQTVQNFLRQEQVFPQPSGVQNIYSVPQQSPQYLPPFAHV